MKIESGKNISADAALFFYDINFEEYTNENMRKIIDIIDFICRMMPDDYKESFYELSNQQQLKILDQSMMYELNTESKILKFLNTRSFYKHEID